MRYGLLLGLILVAIVASAGQDGEPRMKHPPPLKCPYPQGYVYEVDSRGGALKIEVLPGRSSNTHKIVMTGDYRLPSPPPPPVYSLPPKKHPLGKATGHSAGNQ